MPTLESYALTVKSPALNTCCTKGCLKSGCRVLKVRYAAEMVRTELFVVPEGVIANHREKETCTQVQEHRFLSSDFLLISAFLMCKKQRGVGEMYIGLL